MNFSLLLPFLPGLKIASVALDVLVFLAFLSTITLGLSLKRDRWLEDFHLIAARTTLVSTLVLVVVIELTARTAGHSWAGILFQTHLTAAVIFFLLLAAIVLRFNGIRYPKKHKYFVYTCLLFFCIMQGTAVPLFMQLFAQP